MLAVKNNEAINQSPSWAAMKPEDKIPIFLASLPRQKLKKLATTQDLLEFWEELREHNQVIGACLRARFSGGNDPIADWRDDKLGKLFHDFIWNNVDVFQALWNLTQMSYKAVKEEYEKISNVTFPLNDAYDLFLQIVGTGRDNEFRSALHHQKVSTAESAELWKLILKASWSKLETKEAERLNQLTKFEPKNFYIEFTFHVCRMKSKTDSQIAKKLTEYRTQISSLAEAHGALISNTRKGRIPLKLPSYEWQSKQRIYTNPRKSSS